MPTLDVTDVLFDPDFCGFNLWVTRRVQTVDEDGIGSDSEVKKQFAGVVTVDRSLENRSALRSKKSQGRETCPCFSALLEHAIFHTLNNSSCRKATRE